MAQPVQVQEETMQSLIKKFEFLMSKNEKWKNCLYII